jgi:ubiquinone/menaquinone biosynthesis C-methylase UbiE
MNDSSHAPVHLAAGKSATTTDLIIQRRHRLAGQIAPFTGGVLLDFGCGTGAQSLLFVPEFERALGLDIGLAPLEAFCEEADRRGVRDRVVPIQYDGQRFPIADDTVDYAVSFEVLEHVRHEQQTLSELHRVIKPGGTLVMSVPNRWWVFETHGANLPVLPWNRVPFFSWLPKSVHDRYARARIYMRGEIVDKITRSGFAVKRSVYITAPMDVVKWPPGQRFLRATVFRGDATRIPTLSTAVMVAAERL